MSIENGRGGWIRTNAWQDQNLLPYRLAIALYPVLLNALSCVSAPGRKWQGRLDSNQRMAGSKPAALPLRDAPVSCVTQCCLSVYRCPGAVMAGAAGFEPTHGRIKTCCLTAWRRPCNRCYAFTSLPILQARGATSRCYDLVPQNLAEWLEVGGRLYQHRPCLGSSQTHKLQSQSVLPIRICSIRSARYVLLGNASRRLAGSHYDYPPQEGCEL